LENAGVRNGEAETFCKGVVPLSAKKTVPTWGGSVFFARPNFNKKWERRTVPENL